MDLIIVSDQKQELEKEKITANQDDFNKQANPNNPVIQSQFRNRYFEYLGLDSQTVFKIKGQYKHILKQAHISYNDSQINSEWLAVEIISHSLNYEIVVLKVNCGPFQLTINLYNSEDFSPFVKYSNDAHGSFAKIIFTKLLNQKAAAKVYLFDEKIVPWELQLLDVLQQYCFLKIASALQVGPVLFSGMFFDILVFKDSIQFYMQRCQQYQQCAVQAISDLQQLKQNLRILHAFNVVHMDIKSDNICYSPQLQKWIFIDFAFSSALKQNIGQKSWTRFAGSLRYCCSEMAEIYLSKDAGSVDLYYNDAFGLSLSINEIKAYISDASKYDNCALKQSASASQEYSAKLLGTGQDCLESCEFLNTLQIKLILYFGRKWQISHLIQRMNNQILASIKVQALLDYLKQLQLTVQVIEFYSYIFGRYSRNQSPPHRFVNRINYLNTSIDKPKYKQLLGRVQFLQEIRVKFREHKFKKSRDQLQIRKIVLDLEYIKACNQELYYKAFVNFITLNSDRHQATQNQRKAALQTFYQFLMLKPESQNFVKTLNQQNQCQWHTMESRYQLEACLCFLMDECAKLPMTNWKQEYFTFVFEQLILIGGGTVCFLKQVIVRFLGNCRSQEASIRTLVGLQASMHWCNSFYYQIPKYHFLCESFLRDMFLQIMSKCQNDEQQRICFIYAYCQNCLYTEKSLLGDINFYDFQQMISKIRLSKEEFKRELCVFMVCCYLTNKYGEFLRVLQVEQLRDKHRIKYFNYLIVNCYRVGKKYKELLQYYNLFVRIFGERYVLGFSIKADLLILEYSEKKITINQYISALYEMRQANKSYSIKRRIEEIYLALNQDYRDQQIIPKDIQEKIAFLKTTFVLDESSADQLFLNFDLPNVFEIYYQIHQKDPQVIVHLQRMLKKIIQQFQNYQDRRTYERYMRCRYEIIKAKLLCWSQRYSEALQVFRCLVQQQIENQHVTLVLIYSLNCSVNIKQLYNIPSRIDCDILKIYQLCKRQNCFSEYFVLVNGGQLVTHTAIYLFELQSQQLQQFILSLCSFLTSHPSESNIKRFYCCISDAISVLNNRNSQSKLLLLQKGLQKLLPSIQKNTYLCLYFSILARISPLEYLNKILHAIAISLQFVIDYVRIIVLHDYYYLYSKQIEANSRKLNFVINMHLKSAYQQFSKSHIYHHFLDKSCFRLKCNSQLRNQMKLKLFNKFSYGQNLKRSKR